MLTAGPAPPPHGVALMVGSSSLDPLPQCPKGAPTACAGVRLVCFHRERPQAGGFGEKGRMLGGWGLTS